LIQRIRILTALLIFAALTTNAQHSKGVLSISFLHYVDDRPMELDNAVYKNSLGQNFTVTKFKYYISNIQLQKKDGKMISLPGYYLVDEEEPASKKISLKDVPAGEYISLHYIVGVDSLHNCSGAQSGALDPVNAMFWTWNTGYIFLKLEGKAESSTAPGKIIEYHVGGYKKPSNCIREVVLNINTPLTITKDNASVLEIKVNAAELLRTPATVDFSKLPSVTDQKNATMIADNYEDMFSW
jgi:hypothetical protein